MCEVVAITICINYADFLSTTLPHNTQLLDHLYVGTSNADEETPIVCKDVSNVHMTVFDDATQVKCNGKSKFNKSGMLRHLQEQVHRDHPDAWVLILDADIYLPPDFKHIVTQHATEKHALYGMVRHDFLTVADFQKQQKSGIYMYKHAGFFQLYFDKNKYYSPHSRDCSSCDMDFQNQIKPHRLLPGNVSHLGRHTVNWSGRVAPKWEASQPHKG